MDTTDSDVMEQVTGNTVNVTGSGNIASRANVTVVVVSRIPAGMTDLQTVVTEGRMNDGTASNLADVTNVPTDDVTDQTTGVNDVAADVTKKPTDVSDRIAVEFRMFDTFKEFLDALHEVESKHKAKFVHQSTSKSFGSDEWKNRVSGKIVLWEERDSKLVGDGPCIEFDGTPFLVIGRQHLECANGKNRNVGKMRREKAQSTKKYNKIAKSKKLLCPACIVVKELIYFPDFAIIQNTKSRRREMSMLLRESLRKNANKVRTKRIFVARFPGIDSHRNHDIALMSTMRQKLDKRLEAKLFELVYAGVCRSSELKQHLEYCVRMELFAGQTPPPPTDTRFWPSVRTILNLVYKARAVRRRHALCNEGNNAASSCNDAQQDSEENPREETATAVDTNRESLRLKLPVQILDLLPHMVSNANSVLHVNAVGDRGSTVKLLCSLDPNGFITFDFEGEKSTVYETSGQTVSCGMASFDHPAYLMTNDSAAAPTEENDFADSDLEALTTGEQQVQVDYVPDALAGQIEKVAEASERRSQPLVNCDICGKLVLRRRILAHRRVAHKIGDMKPPPSLKCVYCPKRCCEPQLLQTHLKYHQGELLVVCLLCHKTFVDEFVAQGHILHVHCADYRYHCGECGRGFWKRTTMQQHVCLPSDRDSNIWRRQTYNEKMLQLQELNIPLYAVVNPFTEVPYDDATGGYVWLCLVCKKPFYDQFTFIHHRCSRHISSCYYCGRRFFNERQSNNHSCTTDPPTDCIKQMCVAVAQHTDVTGIVSHDRALFEDYESDDDVPTDDLRPKLSRAGRRPIGASDPASHLTVTRPTDAGDAAAVETPAQDALCKRKIRPFKRLRLEAGTGDAKEAVPERVTFLVGKKMLRQKRIAMKANARRNLLLKKDADVKSQVTKDVGSDKVADSSNVATDAVVKTESAAPAYVSPYGTRKRKVCYVALSRGNLEDYEDGVLTDL